jgi:uncharacterized protein
MNVRERELLDYTVEELKRIPEVQAVYLYGSQARGEAGPMSDIDVCVLAEKGISKEVKNRIYACSSGEDIRLFWKLPAHIRSRAVKEGELLFERDWVANHRAQMQSMREYIDLKPFLDRQVRKVLNIQ